MATTTEAYGKMEDVFERVIELISEVQSIEEKCENKGIALDGEYSEALNNAPVGEIDTIENYLNSLANTLAKKLE